MNYLSSYILGGTFGSMIAVGITNKNNDNFYYNKLESQQAGCEYKHNQKCINVWIPESLSIAAEKHKEIK
jgi:hypothetical protein